MSLDAPVVARMRSLVESWEETLDPRTVFLSCYMMMTRNVLAAIEAQEFRDPEWVHRLLHRFADYYFVALDAHEASPESAPAVWQLAFDATGDPSTSALQRLLLGVNAHINYDLVFTLVDLLAPEWASLSQDRRALRYADHCHVNDVIARTIDAVQEQILEPAMPLMALVDTLLGPLDEFMISRLIAHWREAVWRNATGLLGAGAEEEQAALVGQIREDAVKLGELICTRAVA